MGKNGRREKNRARLCIVYIFKYLYIDRYPLQWLQGNIYREVFPTFLAKKSYGWWITRRRMEIYTKISKRVGAQISQFRMLHGDLRKFRKLISQLWIHFRTLEFQFRKVRNCPSAGCSCLAKAISSSFQIQIVHGLKRWILDFLRFEMVYSM